MTKLHRGKSTSENEICTKRKRKKTTVSFHLELNIQMIYFQATAEKWRYRRCLRHRLEAKSSTRNCLFLSSCWIRIRCGTGSDWLKQKRYSFYKKYLFVVGAKYLSNQKNLVLFIFCLLSNQGKVVILGKPPKEQLRISTNFCEIIVLEFWAKITP